MQAVVTPTAPRSRERRPWAHRPRTDAPRPAQLPRRASAHGASPFGAKITKHYRGKLQTEIKDISLPNPVIRSAASCSTTSAST
jgi:hypothetical protein